MKPMKPVRTNRIMKIHITILLALTLLRLVMADDSSPILVEPMDGGTLPKFGRVVAWIDPITGEKKFSKCRTVDSRMRDYFHECIKRNPIKTVDKHSIAKWKDARFQKRSLPNMNSQYGRELVFIENLTANVAAEFYRYGKKVDLSKCIAEINTFYSEKYVMRWEGLSRWKKYGKAFDAKFEYILEELHSKLDALDVVHQSEFMAWQQENPVAYAERVKLIQDREQHVATTIRLEQNKREIQAAKAEAEASKQAAIAAERRAAAAEAAARDAEAAAISVRQDLNLW